MINSGIKSNAQPWELEVVCKNKKYLDEVVKAVLKCGNLSFEVNTEELSSDSNGNFDGIYTVLIWCCWFNNLSSLAQDLEKIETKLG